ncbi:acyl-CoA dehydrogenase family protein [Mycolicibacterium sp. P9-22]|uniref:acyl-CoA dehydrogenase family protein n=1 Tax=Mycolicibacterium sp. P9-22 TaxID=2024613 RepID=UPI0011EF50F4|nr:acyl-CoA dehydrogenase family protein [Mycolicibacterium sp. P9-22]KAA0120642.1 acyl-CoA dehydrogenase [Mycolicibacterium sp. P9-22]
MSIKLEHLPITTLGHDSIRESVRSLNAKYPLEYWSDLERKHEFPQEYFDDFVKAGWTTMTVPEEFGGGGATVSQASAMLEEVGASGGATAACSTVHSSHIALISLIKYGSDTIKERYLQRMVDGELAVSFGVTEPNAGTDTSRIATTAIRQGDKYIVNGQKVWNSHAQRAEKCLLLCRTSPREGDGGKSMDGMSMFMADLKVPQVTIQPISKLGRNAVDSNEVFFDDLPVDVDDLVGTEGRGFHQIMPSVNTERIFLAAECIGMGRWCLERAVEYAGERVVFDRPIGKNQSVAHPLAQSYIELSGAALAVREAAEAYDAGAAPKEVGRLANVAKFLASEAAFKVADNAMQVFGGYSFATEYHIGRHWIELRPHRIAPVNNQMVLNFVSEKVLGLPRSY